MNTLKNFIGLVFFFFFLSSAQAGDLTQEQWIDYMGNNLPIVFCSPNQYYRECYEFTQEECKENVSFALETCMDVYIDQIPEIFPLKESRKWGSTLEKCVDKEFINEYSDARISNDYCNSIK